MSLLELFCAVDDFYQHFQTTVVPQQLARGRGRKRGPAPTLAVSEIITLIIHFHQGGYRTFKSYYLRYVCKHLTAEFPKLVSYNRFVELMPSVLTVLCAYLQSRYGECTGIAFIDSTPLVVCHNRRISRHRVFRGLAARGKTSMGWFFGFKLHLIVNEHGELIAACLTPGNSDDRRPVPELSRALFGKLFGDKGYISKALFERLFERGVELITGVRRNMKGELLCLSDRLLLRKRFLIETINDQLKNISQIEHSRHRSALNFAVNLLAGLIAYSHQPKKPSLRLEGSHPELPVLI